MGLQFRQKVSGKPALDRFMPLHPAPACRLRNAYQRIETPLEIGTKLCHISDAAVVRQVDRFRLVRQKALDRRVHRLRIELRRRGGREYECAAIDIVLAVGQTEHVATENPARPAIDDADMVASMAGRIETQQLAAGQ